MPPEETLLHAPHLNVLGAFLPRLVILITGQRESDGIVLITVVLIVTVLNTPSQASLRMPVSLQYRAEVTVNNALKVCPSRKIGGIKSVST